MVNHRLTSALALYEEGYAIFPIARDSKTPIVKWSEDWAASRNQVVEHWTACPEDNIGINCKESALLVIDLDGREGIENFTALWQKHERGRIRRYTRCSTTPNAGLHVWFDMPYDPLPLRNSVGMLAEHVDTRGAGGIIVAPGSEIDGRWYALLNHLPVAPCPTWLVAKLRRLEPPLSVRLRPVTPWSEPYSRMMLAEVSSRVAVALRGRRNAALNKEAWRMRQAVPTLGLEAVEDELLAAAEVAGLPEYEARATIRSGLGC